jgi:hypothetical protein
MNAQARVHQLLAAHALVKIERLYATVLQSLMGCHLEDRPWKTVLPRDPERKRLCTGCDGE